MIRSEQVCVAEDRWYAVYTLPSREFEAARHLEKQGFRAFLPRRLKTVRHARKVQTKVAAFFPRYAFVALDPERHRWRSVNGTFGVVSLIGNGGAPMPVPRGVVETLVASTDKRGLLCFQEPLEPGQRVRLLAGPFAEQFGVLERVDENGSVRVLLDIMGGRIPVRLARDHILAAA